MMILSKAVMIDKKDARVLFEKLHFQLSISCNFFLWKHSNSNEMFLRKYYFLKSNVL